MIVLRSEVKMKRKLFLLICGILAVSAFFAGCTARVDKTADLSADDLVGMIGAGYDDIKRAMGNVDDGINGQDSSHYSYKRSVFGTDSNISVTMDKNGEKVEKVTIYTDKDILDKWRSAFGDKYGKGIMDKWDDGKTRVSITDSGENGIISIEKIA